MSTLINFFSFTLWLFSGKSIKESYITVASETSTVAHATIIPDIKHFRFILLFMYDISPDLIYFV
jgi:hypothetical protein